MKQLLLTLLFVPVFAYAQIINTIAGNGQPVWWRWWRESGEVCEAIKGFL